MGRQTCSYAQALPESPPTLGRSAQGCGAQVLRQKQPGMRTGQTERSLRKAFGQGTIHQTVLQRRGFAWSGSDQAYKREWQKLSVDHSRYRRRADHWVCPVWLGADNQ